MQILHHDSRVWSVTYPFALHFYAYGQITSKLQISRKEVDDVLGGEEAWKNVDRTEGKIMYPYIMNILCWCT